MKVKLWIPDILYKKAKERKLVISRILRNALEKKLKMKLPERMPYKKRKKIEKPVKKEADDILLPL